MIFALFIAAVSSLRYFAGNENSVSRRVLDDPTAYPAHDHINVGTYAGATAGVTLGFFIILVFIYCFGCRTKEVSATEQQLLQSTDLGASDQGAAQL